MTRRDLSFRAPPSAEIAADATAPNPGVVGATVWSTSAAVTLTWDGSAWRAPAAGGGGGSYTPSMEVIHAALLSF